VHHIQAHHALLRLFVLTEDSYRMYLRIFCLRTISVSLILGMLPGCMQRDIAKSEPNTTNIYLSRLENDPVDKIDLLFVVDNSASMGDKQQILELAVPQMLERLVRPDCVTRDAQGLVVAREKSTPPAVPGDDPACAGDLVLEFNPINDIHIGVISSSLGGHGSSSCPTDPTIKGAKPENNDRALLMPKVRADLVDPHKTGFLVWHPAEPDDAPGTPVESDLEQLKAHFRAHVAAAGETGCGFEAPLEAWYRFLVDPAPPLSVEKVESRSVATGPDAAVLEQRAAFLRPDSLVGIVVLTDENDCSVMDGGSLYPFAEFGWMLSEYNQSLIFDQDDRSSENVHMAAATPACSTNPNDPCCFSCFQDKLPNDCKDPSALASCESQGWPRLSPEADHPNSRCAKNRERFGIDLLYPIERYVDALRLPMLTNSQTGKEFKNPLLWGVTGNEARRDGLIFFAGITGLPWQDIADEKSLESETELTYLNSTQLRNKDVSVNLNGIAEMMDRWQLILGTPNKSANSRACQKDSVAGCGRAPVLPLDPFMIESIAQRSGTNPLTSISTTTSPAWNPVNGHEQVSPDGGDLQYSCTFPLEPYGGVRTCGPMEEACDCTDPSQDRPLCKTGAGEAPTTTQHFGKAYPGTRILEVLEGFGQNAIPASICPKVHDPNQGAFGYNPAVAAIIDRLATGLQGECLPRPLSVGEDGLVDCVVVEARKAKDGMLDCGAQGRIEISADFKEKVLSELAKTSWCTGADCSSASLCEIVQLNEVEHPAEREACLTSPVGSEATLDAGYCYIDANQMIGDANLVAQCGATQRQLLRFVGEKTPAPKTTTFIACSGELIY
jgi:hypothetical protein